MTNEGLEAARIKLRSAQRAWREARERCEESFLPEAVDRDDSDALAESGAVLECVCRELARRTAKELRRLEPLEAILSEAFGALEELAEQEGLEAERSARHGELAAVAHAAQERTDQLDSVRERVRDAWEALRDASEELERL